VIPDIGYYGLYHFTDGVKETRYRQEPALEYISVTIRAGMSLTILGHPRSLYGIALMKHIVQQIVTSERYQTDIEYGEPRSGHPEGKVKNHIAELEANLEALASRRGLSPGDYWKLKFLIHVHDTFKAEAEPDVAILHPRSHASLARAYAAQFTADADLLNMIQFHDENYALWKQYAQTGTYSPERFQSLLQTIQDWDLFLMFTIVDGATPGKDHEKLAWFINEVRKYMATIVDETWVP